MKTDEMKLLNKQFYDSLFLGMVLNLEYIKLNKDALLTGVFTNPEVQSEEIDWYCGIDGESDNDISDFGFDISSILTYQDKTRTYNSIDFLVRNVPDPSIYLNANHNNSELYPFDQEFLTILVNRSSPVIDVDPQILVNDLESGTAIEGDTLTLINGTYLTPVESFTYQWERNSTTIEAATSNSYVITSDDLNKIITCKVTATNSKGSLLSTSNEIDT